MPNTSAIVLTTTTTTSQPAARTPTTRTSEPYLGWCVRDGRIDTNPAARNTATEELPDDADRPERQFWHERDRNAIFAFVDKRVDDSFDEDSDVSQKRAYRDRALVYLLALSGVRRAEVFDAPDHRRNGLRWSDVDLENGTLEVLGKSREYQYVPLPKRVCTALERYRQVAEPPINDAFVFPTAHAPSKYGAVRNQLDNVDELLENTDVDR